MKSIILEQIRREFSNKEDEIITVYYNHVKALLSIVWMYL